MLSPSFFSLYIHYEVARQNCYYCQSRHLLDDLGWFFTHVFGTHCAQPQLENLVQKSHPKIFINSQPSIFFNRRMFPTVRCSFANLRPDMRYWVLLDIVPCDNKRYRYAYHRSSWLVAGKADPAPPHRLYPHPDAPFTGEQLRKQVVSFEKVKLTNNEMDKNGQVNFFFLALLEKKKFV